MKYIAIQRSFVVKTYMRKNLISLAI